MDENNRKKKGWLKTLGEALYMELREHRSSFIVYFTLRLLVIVMLVLQLLNRNYENVFLCGLTLLLLVVPSFVQVTFKVELPTVLEIIILILYLLRRYWERSANFISCSRFGIRCCIRSTDFLRRRSDFLLWIF